MVEIEFGTLIKVKDRFKNTAVVTDVYENKDFNVYFIFSGEDGQYMRELAGGTLDRDKVDEIIGKLTLEQIEELINKGYKYPELAEMTIKHLRGNFKKGKRTV